MKLKIIKIADYDDEKQRLTYQEAIKAAKAKGCRLLTVEEALFYITREQNLEFRSAFPFWVYLPKDAINKLQPPVRGYFLSRRYVYLDVGSDYRLGVLGVPIKNKKELKP